jgi:RHS repeat-associated protein
VKRSATVDAVRQFQGGNLSGAVIDSPGCHQFAGTAGYAVDAQLPFWINFLGKAYRHAFVRNDGYVYFDGGIDGDPQGNSAPYPTGELQADYTNYESRLIAPFFSLGPPWQPSGALATSWGETTYNGHDAFCVEWSDEYNQDFCISTFPTDFSKTNNFQLLLVNRNDTGVGKDNFDIVFNYGSIQWDHPGTDSGDAIRGWKCGDAASAGWKTGSSDPGASALLDGSWTYGAFLDNSATSLISRSLGDPQLGRFVWNIRNATEAPHVDPYQTFGPPTNGLSGAWATNPTAGQGEPVNSATGSYYTALTDLTLAGVGVPFSFERSYNSGDPTGGPLGPGWTHSLNASLAVQPNGDVLARSGEGQQLLFSHNSDGSFTPSIGGRSSLAVVTGGYELITHDQLHFRFNAQGQLTGERDRNGQGLSLTYNPDGTLAAVLDSVGRTVSFAYTSGLLSQVSLPDGRHVSYGYDNGRLATVTDARGGTTSYTYDGGGRLATILDQNNHTVIQNTYAGGRVIEQRDARGNLSTFDWNADTQTATYTDPRGNKWQDVYLNNVLIDQIDPLENRTHFLYDTALNVTGVIDPRGNEMDSTYDGQGNMLTRTAPTPLSYTETWTYDSFNNIKTYKNRRGKTTTYGYDASGNLTSVTGPDPGSGAPVTQYGRDPAGTGLLTSITDPRSKATTYSYTDGNLSSITTPLGEKTTMSYDGSGRKLTQVDARGNVAGSDPSQYTTTLTYDNADHLLTRTDPLNHTTTSTYDPAGNLLSVKDANNHTTVYGYDAANHLTSVTAPDQTQTAYIYDGVGNRTTRTDANNHATTFGYDTANRLISMTTPGGRKWTYGYDKNGNRTQIVDASGNATPTGGDGTITYDYDQLNRVTAYFYSDLQGGHTSHFYYDQNGNRTEITDNFGNTVEQATYDALDRLLGASAYGNGFSYAYDKAGNVTQRTYPGNAVATYTYDDDERMQNVTNSGATTSYGYDAASNLKTTTLPVGNGYVETRSYDRASRLTELKTQKGSSVLADVLLTLDPVGNPLSAVQSGATSITANYSYDSRDWLTSVCYQATPCTSGTSPFIRWTYDSVGNRLTEARPTGTTTSSYDVDDRLLSAGATSYSYDANGNETAAGSTTFTYNGLNQLLSTTNGRTTTTYSYSADGRRLTASTGSNASSNTKFAWDVLGSFPQLAVEQDGNGALLRSYLYGLNRVAMRSGGANYYYHYDQLGSVINVTSSTGATQWTESYEPYGALRTETKNSNQAPANLMKFTGEYLDPTGLYHLRARQYDPKSGRFLSRDPLQPTVDSPYAQAYDYVNNRPTVGTDPTGECFLVCAVVGAVVNEAFYVSSVVSGQQSFSWGGSLQAAAYGALEGATGGLTASWVGRAVAPLARGVAGRAIAATVGGAAGGSLVTQAASLFGGCGLASVAETVQGGVAGAAGAVVGERFFPSKTWASAIAGAAYTYQRGTGGSCK